MEDKEKQELARELRGLCFANPGPQNDFKATNEKEARRLQQNQIMANLKLDKASFNTRIKKVYCAWMEQEHSDFSTVDAIAVSVGLDDESISYMKSSTLQLWLFGYEMTDVVMIFCEKKLFFLASQKKIDFLKQIDTEKENDKYTPEITFLVRNKKDKDKENFETLMAAIKESKQGRVVGGFQRDVYKGEFFKEWKNTLKSGTFEHKELGAAFAFVLAVKEPNEVETMRKACQATCDLYSKFVKKEIVKIIDREKKVKHSKLSEDVETASQDKKYFPSLDVTQLDVCYSPIIQSGGNYQLKYSVTSDEKNMKFDSIITMMGLRYKSYCSNIIRTVLFEPGQSVKEAYELLLKAEDHLISQLRDGANLSQLYQSVVTLIQDEKPTFVDKLTRNFGFATGIEFREGSLLIGPKSTVEAKSGMVFNISIGFSNVENDKQDDGQAKHYALFVGDTVLVVGTDDDEEDEESQEQAVEELGRGKRSAILDSKTRAEAFTDQKRLEKQQELYEKLMDDAQARMGKQTGGPQQKKVKKSLVSYKAFTQIPFNVEECKRGKVFVDKKFETVILPVFGLPSPFHISTIKNVSQSVDGDYTYLRINFFHPGAAIGKEGPIFQNPDATFLKEMTFRSSNKKEPGELSAPSSNLNTAFRLIKEVQKKFRTRELEEKEKEGIVEQEDLKLSRKPGNPKLKDLMVRPNIIQKKIAGNLEAHENGFRYTSLRGDKVDILYQNIKSAFFQPCDGEMIILLHFHLKNAILFGKKKHIDIQFFTEVGEITTDLGKHHHMHDRDDLHAEQAERELRNKLKLAFKSFTEKIEHATNGQVEFDTPFRELGFYGCPFRSNVLLQPTSACLVQLIEWPPFVVTLDEIELAHFERVNFHLKNFDMVFVFKDYNRKPVMITSIPFQYLDHLKEWLHSCDIYYTEGIQSLNWPKIMKTIVDDPEAFFDNGGWNFLDPHGGDSSDNESGGSEDEDDAYVPSDSDEAEEEDEDEEVEEEEEDESDDSDYSASEGGSSDESGKSWSELEEEAKKADRERGDYGGEPDLSSNRHHRKRKLSGRPKKKTPTKKRRR